MGDQDYMFLPSVKDLVKVHNKSELYIIQNCGHVVNVDKPDIFNKKILILGAGGVVPSIIYCLKKMKVSKITLSNRTKEKADSPTETNFLKKAKAYGNRTENGKMMFIYQAHQAFTIWHKLMPKIDDDVIKLVE